MKRSVFLLLDRYGPRDDSHREALEFALDHARLADELGFHSLWVTEHHFNSLGAPHPAVLLAALAARTERLRIGPAVSVLPYREPIYIAEDYAVVDVVSGGRLNMGVGCGSQLGEFEGLGIPFDDRWSTFERSLSRLRELWNDSELNVAPVQTPPPIYVATTNPDKAHAVGRSGDSVITLLGPGTSDLDGLSRLLDSHRRGLEAGGRPSESAEVVVTQFAVVAEDDEFARREAVEALRRVVMLLGGSGDGVDEMVDTMRKAGTACIGTEDDAARAVAMLEELGVGHVAYATRFGGVSAQLAHDALRCLGPRSEVDAARFVSK